MEERRRQAARLSARISPELLESARIAAREEGRTLASWTKKAMEGRLGMERFDIKKKIVESGNSSIYENWHAVAGITQAEFLEALEWLCDDPETITREVPADPDGGTRTIERLTREIGLVVPPDARMRAFMEDPKVPEAMKRAYGGTWDEDKARGRIVKLRRCYDVFGEFTSFRYAEDAAGHRAGDLWDGNVGLSARDRV